MQNVVSKMNRNAAKPAVTTEKLLLVDRENISQQFAPNADKMQKSRLSPKQTDLFIAAIALPRQGNNKYVTDNKGHYHC